MSSEGMEATEEEMQDSFAGEEAIVDAGDTCVTVWVTVAPVPRPLQPRLADAGARQCPWGVEEP